MKNGDIVKRNGNYFIVKRDKHNHYYTALLLGNARITAWHRTTLLKLKTLYEKVNKEEYKERKFDYENGN